MEFTVESIKKAMNETTGGAPYEYAWDCGFDGLSEDTVWENLVTNIWYQVDPDEEGNDKELEVILSKLIDPKKWVSAIERGRRESEALPVLRQDDMAEYEKLVSASFRQW